MESKLAGRKVLAICASFATVANGPAGRAEWEEGEHPIAWRAAVNAEVKHEQKRIRAVWSKARDAEMAQIEVDLDRLITELTERLLTKFYPASVALFSSDQSAKTRDLCEDKHAIGSTGRRPLTDLW